jgi:hypothetical protein
LLLLLLLMLLKFLHQHWPHRHRMLAYTCRQPSQYPNTEGLAKLSGSKQLPEHRLQYRCPQLVCTRLVLVLVLMLMLVVLVLVLVVLVLVLVVLVLVLRLLCIYRTGPSANHKQQTTHPCLLLLLFTLLLRVLHCPPFVPTTHKLEEFSRRRWYHPSLLFLPLLLLHGWALWGFGAQGPPGAH